ncbi:hypothetical protein JCM5353_000740 [Sporobolomyces roseus]
MTTIQSLPLYLFDNISDFLPVEGDDSFCTRGMISKADLDGATYKAIINLSSCNRQLRNLLFSSVFRTIKLGEPAKSRTRSYQTKMEWMLASDSRVFATAQHVSLWDFFPESFQKANECLERMVSLRKYTHASTLPIHQIFLSTLRQLPNLNLINMCYGGAESFTSLIALAPKIVSLELQLYREVIKVPDCLEVSPRSLPSEDSSKPNGRPSVVKFRRSVIEGIAELLVKARDNLQVLYLDVPPWEREDFGKDWWEVAVRQSKRVLQPISLPSLKRLNIENAHFTPKLLKELLEAAPYLSHLALAILRKPEAEMLAPARPLLKRLNVFFQDCTKRYPVFLSSLTAGATLEHAYLNGITPIDLADFVKSPDFSSALSLRTLRILFDTEKPLRPGHFDKLAKTCLNLTEFDFQGRLEADPPAYFTVLSQLPKLSHLTLNHPWDSRVGQVGGSQMFAHDGKSIRTEEMKNFLILYLNGTSVNQEVRNRIRQDLDGVRPLYVQRFGAAARTLPALQTLVWNPTAEVEWTWTYFRDGERIKFKENAVITYSKGPKGDEPERAVVMNPPLSSY